MKEVLAAKYSSKLRLKFAFYVSIAVGNSLSVGVELYLTHHWVINGHD